MSAASGARVMAQVFFFCLFFVFFSYSIASGARVMAQARILKRTVNTVTFYFIFYFIFLFPIACTLDKSTVYRVSLDSLASVSVLVHLYSQYFCIDYVFTVLLY